MEFETDTIFEKNMEHGVDNITSITYTISKDRWWVSCFTIYFSDNSKLSVECCETVDNNNGGAIMFSNMSELKDNYTLMKKQIDMDAINKNVAMTTNVKVLHSILSLTGDCDEILYILIDNQQIPLFGYRSIHNGYYAVRADITYESVNDSNSNFKSKLYM